ncbi:MAG: tRNA 2-thiouridine(34) synthase MnmA [Lachnospiraceae bacterium]|nr:tRNA 2-thiouridine(34) synthase MnmA [Lachnospiraceae bacterium]
MSKVVVGLSGGVDSAVTAYLLKEQGYEVVGVTLRTWVDSDTEVSKCCEMEDARRICLKLGIPYHIQNVGKDFCKYVTTPFVSEYINGRTPSPCVECNRYVKFAGMRYVAELLQADFIATGHYARVVRLPNGRYSVQHTPTSKDQTYMLYKLTQDQLSALLMPLCDYTKAEVREIARKAEIPVAEKSDSQEICFVEDGCYPQYVTERAKTVFADNYEKIANRLGPGNFVDGEGKILGEHKGIIRYTIGQRKGLGLAFGHPVYVREIRPETNEVVLCEEETLWGSKITCTDLNFMSIEEPAAGETIRAKVKIRYRHDGEWADLKMQEDGRVLITFEKAVRAATPGQAAVFYDENGYVIGGGKICELR